MVLFCVVLLGYKFSNRRICGAKHNMDYMIYSVTEHFLLNLNSRTTKSLTVSPIKPNLACLNKCQIRLIHFEAFYIPLGITLLVGLDNVVHKIFPER